MLFQALHVATDTNPELALQLTSTTGAVDALIAVARYGTAAPSSLPPLAPLPLAARLQAAGALVNAAQSAGALGASAAAQQWLSSALLPLLVEALRYDGSAIDRACDRLRAVAATAGRSDGDGGSGGARGSGSDETAARVAGNGSATGSDGGGGNGSNGSGGNNGNGGINGDKMDTEPCDGNKKAKRGGMDTDGLDPLEAVRWQWKHEVAEPLMLAAEVLTNAVSLAADAADAAAAEEGEESLDGEDWGSDDEAEQAMERAATGNSHGGGSSSGGASESRAAVEASPLLRAFVEAGALPMVLSALEALMPPLPTGPAVAAVGGAVAAAAALASPPLPLPPLPAAVATDLASDLADLRSTVALCAANLVQNLPAAGVADPPAVWGGLCSLCVAALAPPSSLDNCAPPLAGSARAAVEPLTSVMWALARRFGALFAAATLPAVSDCGALPLLLRLLDPLETPGAEARANAVGTLGALAAAAPPAALAAAAAADVATALRGALADAEVLVQGEALEAVMDVFGSEEQQAAFDGAGLLSAVAAATPRFRSKVAADGPALGRDAHAHLRETTLNAARFVKYKRALK
ncbi:unnamed protein product [Phaeothamnion confervicola]